MPSAPRPRERQVALLPKQLELVQAHDAIKHKIILYRGGYRSGKTTALVAKAIDLGLRHWPHPVLAMEPTYPMVLSVFVETARRMCAEWGLACKWQVTKKTLTIGDRRPITIWCRSADARQAIEGLSVASLIADEWELYDLDVIKVAMARVSIGPAATQQIVLGGTPEGFGPGYEFVEKDPAPTTKIIVARTMDNPYIRDSYVADMRSRFSDEEAAEKLDGVRTAPAGRTYTRFDLATHAQGPPSFDLATGRLQFFAGFDTEKMAWAAVLVSPDSRSFHVVGEVIGHRTDSQAQARAARDWVIAWEASRGRRIGHDHVRLMNIPVICDPAVIGAHGAGAMSLSHLRNLQEAGFRPLYGKKIARYDDRVAGAQKLLAERRLTLDDQRAPYLTRCIAHSKTAKRGGPDARAGLLQGELALTNGLHWHCPAFRPATAHVEEHRAQAWETARKEPPKTRQTVLGTLANALQTRLVSAMPGKRAGHAVEDLGCTIPEFMDYIERKWTAGMSWENWGHYGWHLDHIRPLASVSPEDAGAMRKVLHFSNYQPLWAAENRLKGSRWDGG